MSALRNAPGRLLDALAELRVGVTPPASRASFNRPIGRHRRFGTVQADLDAVRAVGRRAGATVNDVVLSAVGGALGTVMTNRGTHLDRIVVAAPVAGRPGATASELGNQFGVSPMVVPTAGSPFERLCAVAEHNRKHRSEARGGSATLVAPAFRFLGALGMLRWVAERQPFVNCFVTNLRGPDSTVNLLGAAVTEIVPLTIIAGNVPIAFAVLSYAGRLTITVVADVGVVPDAEVLVQALQKQLDLLTTTEAN
jgi:diacylglycerol O-acyltransferase / wax synthase